MGVVKVMSVMEVEDLILGNGSDDADGNNCSYRILPTLAICKSCSLLLQKAMAS